MGRLEHQTCSGGNTRLVALLGCEGVCGAAAPEEGVHPPKWEPEVQVFGEGGEVGNTHRRGRMSPCTSYSNRASGWKTKSQLPQSWTHCPLTNGASSAASERS